MIRSGEMIMSKTILLIDDDLTSSNLLRMFLNMEGYTVESRFDYDEALAGLEGQIDLMITDVHLPQNRSGLELVKAVREGATPQNGQLPIIVTSGDDRIQQEAIEVGANAFLLKPFTSENLIQLMQGMLPA